MQFTHSTREQEEQGYSLRKMSPEDLMQSYSTGDRQAEQGGRVGPLYGLESIRHNRA